MDYKVEMKPLEWFSENPENYRAHPEEQLDVLQQSLERFGVFRNVVARPDGTILAGHGILRAAQRKGLTEFPTVVFEGSDAEARALMVADNEQSRLAQDDDRALTELLKGLNDEDPALLEVTGYDAMKLANLLLVTRDEHEIPDFDAAAEWVGLPTVDDDDERVAAVKLVVWFDNETDRDQFMTNNDLRNVYTGGKHRGTSSAWWPPREREAGLNRFVEEV